jgi:hypothetical protein
MTERWKNPAFRERMRHDPSISFRKHIPHHQTEQGRKELFHQYGFETLVIWDRELTDTQSLEAKILDFNGGKHLF